MIRFSLFSIIITPYFVQKTFFLPKMTSFVRLISWFIGYRFSENIKCLELSPVGFSETLKWFELFSSDFQKP